MPKPPSSEIPRPEYPRPQLVRPEWQNLNGQWEFAFDDENIGIQEGWQDGRHLPQQITVPYAYQTALSGIGDTAIHEVVWYARGFSIPDSYREQDLLLHFGAVDYRASIWINGREVGHNQGGHVPFTFQISPYLVPGENRLTVRVADAQDPHQPRGKQAVDGQAREIDYYCTTGIWQTVWLEPVPTMRIDDIRITPLFKEQAFELLAFLHAPAGHWKLEATASFKGQEVVRVSQETTNATSRLFLRIPEASQWTPEEPNLYDLEIHLFDDDGDKCDSVASYAGMRSVAVADGSFMLNEQPTYLAMVLDQGYWPKGGMTAPTDDDLKKDVEWVKKFGYNGVRKHQKVEDPRWLYWCDVLGLMVWSEMANARAWSPAAEDWLMAEWDRAVRRDYNHPSVVAWVPMNESWGVPDLRQDHPGQYAYLERIVGLTRRLDQFRPVVDNDGWEHTDITDICAIHDYTADPERLQDRYKEVFNGSLPERAWLSDIPLFARGSTYHRQPIMLTEVGGFLMIPEGVPAEQRDILYNFYGSINSAAELQEKYIGLMEGIAKLPFVAGFCYTQLVDVEQEINGLLTYDRVVKVKPEVLAAVHKKIIRGYKGRGS